MPFLDGALTQAAADLWLQGFSGGEIAAKLSKELHRPVTRAAVMGRLFRLRGKEPEALAGRPLRPRVNPLSERRTPRQSSGRKVTIKVNHTISLPAPSVAPGRALPLTMLSLPSGAIIPWHSSRGCAYIANDDPRAPAWCNAPVVLGSAWCAYHHQRLSVAPRR